MNSVARGWWQDTLAALRRHDLPAARRAASQAVDGSADPRPWLALAAIHQAMGDLRTARDALQRAYDRHSFVRIPAAREDARRVLVLRAIHLESLSLQPNGAFSSGASVDWSLYLDGEFEQTLLMPEALEQHPERLAEVRQMGDAVVNLITDPDAVAAELHRAARIVDALSLPVVNHPNQVTACGRASNHDRLSGIPGVVFPFTFDIDLPPVRREALQYIREACEKVGYPIILRRAGWHDGRFMTRIDSPAAIDSTPLAPGGGRYHVIRYHNTARDDGIYRKIRMFCIAGHWYPRHVFSGRRWNVHWAAYQELLSTEAGRELQRQELGFLHGWEKAIGVDGCRALDEIADKVALDWFGMDFTVLPSGEIFVFEVNPSMRLTGSQLHAASPDRVRSLAEFREAIVTATRTLVYQRIESGSP